MGMSHVRADQAGMTLLGGGLPGWATPPGLLTPLRLITWGLGGTAMLGRGDATNRDAGSSLAGGYKMLWVTGPLPRFRKGTELPPRGREALIPARARGMASAALTKT